MFKRRILTTLGLTAVAAGAISLAPVSAGAAVSCAYSGATDTASVTLGAASDVATVRRNGTAIQVNGANCGAATVNNTDTINATGTAASGQSVVIDLSGGALGPGQTAETGTGAVSEIELFVDLRAGSVEEIRVVGGTGSDRAIFGTAGARLNTDSDVDLTFSGLDQVELDGAAGTDTLSTAGGGSVGSPLNKFSDIDGGADGDTLTGGRASDTIVGFTGTDVIGGGAGGDTIRGGDDVDDVSGNEGFDNIDGDAGSDEL